MRMSDLGIPFEAVIAGVRRQPFAALPAKFRHQEHAVLRLRTLPFLPIGIGPEVAARFGQAAAFIDSRVVKAIVVGADELTVTSMSLTRHRSRRRSRGATSRDQ
jgi:hypothetical protein